MNDDRFQVYAEKLYEKDEKICTFLGHFWAGFVQGSQKEFLEIQFDMLAQSQPDLKVLCNKKNMYLKDVRDFISKNATEKIMPINLKQYSTFVYGNFRDTRINSEILF